MRTTTPSVLHVLSASLSSHTLGWDVRMNLSSEMSVGRQGRRDESKPHSGPETNKRGICEWKPSSVILMKFSSHRKELCAPSVAWSQKYKPLFHSGLDGGFNRRGKGHGFQDHHHLIEAGFLWLASGKEIMKKKISKQHLTFWHFFNDFFKPQLASQTRKPNQLGV